MNTGLEEQLDLYIDHIDNHDKDSIIRVLLLLKVRIKIKQ